MSKKYLNLDALVGEVGTVVLQGKEHHIPEMEVGQFVQLLKARQETEDSGDETQALDTAKKLISTVVPTMTEEVLDTLTLRQLRALMDFIVDDVQGAVEDEDDAGNDGAVTESNK